MTTYVIIGAIGALCFAAGCNLFWGELLGTLYMASGRNGETHNEDHYEFDEETKT